MTLALDTDHAPPIVPLDPAQRLDHLRLARSQNVGPRSYASLIRRYRSAARALEALPELAGRGGKRDYVPCPVEVAEAEIAAGMAAGAELLVIGEAAYPPLLAAIDNPPPVLWLRGQAPVLRREAIAVVGARNASALGLRTARQIVGDLGLQGLVIVSGLARGIDTAAHEAALETGTLAVLAGGIDQIYPEENCALADQIAEGGALLSECPVGVEPTARHFPKRNRLIAGLGRAVLLIEAATRSGSLITARNALDQGRDVMACPGAPQDPRVGGCNALIRDGAALIRNAEDVAEVLASPRLQGLAEPGGGFLFDADDYGDATMRDDYDALADFDEGGAPDDRALSDQVLSLIGPNPVEIDEVARQCGTSTADLSLVILELELAGQIEVLAGAQIMRAEPAA